MRITGEARDSFANPKTPREGKNPIEKLSIVVCQQRGPDVAEQHQILDEQIPAQKGDRNCCQRRYQADDVLSQNTSKAGRPMHGSDLGRSNHVPDRIRLRETGDEQIQESMDPRSNASGSIIRSSTIASDPRRSAGVCIRSTTIASAPRRRGHEAMRHRKQKEKKGYFKGQAWENSLYRAMLLNRDRDRDR